MKLVLYSGGERDINEELDYELIEMIGKRKPSVAFIPSSYDDAEEYFEEFMEHYEFYGFEDFTMFPIDVAFTPYQAKRILNKDLVYLSGGNTFYFLHHMRKSGFGHFLKEYVASGRGVLAGQSAGSIMMTPNITMASLPEFDCDENDIGINNWRSLGLVGFEFFPHYLNTRRYIHELNIASANLPHPIYAFPDGSGIAVNHHKISFIGNSWMFFRGKKVKTWKWFD